MGKTLYVVELQNAWGHWSIDEGPFKTKQEAEKEIKRLQRMCPNIGFRVSEAKYERHLVVQ